MTPCCAGSPHSVLERQMQAELQLPHCGSKQDVGNLPRCATARVRGRERRDSLSTAALVLGVAQGDMVEDVVRVHAELQVEAFSKLEVLRDVRIGGIVAYPVQ